MKKGDSRRVDEALRGVARGLRGREHLEQDRELVAAEPGRGVGAAQHRLEPGRDVDEEPVADGVAEAVVDGLERVEVDEQHGGGVVARGAGASRGRRGRRTARGSGRLVSESWNAWCRSSASRRLRWVTSWIATSTAARPRNGSWCEFTSTSMRRPSFSWWRQTPERCISDPWIRELGEEALGLVVRVHVADETIEELVARVAVVMDRRLVDLEEGERARVVDPHRLRVVEEQLAGVGLARTELELARPQLAPHCVPAPRSWYRAGAR